jgi:putative transcriptional regulator
LSHLPWAFFPRVNVARRCVNRSLPALEEFTPLRNHIRKARTEKHWSQGQVAQKTGVARQTINAIENSRSVPTLELALKLARAFDMRVEELFQLDEMSLKTVRRESPF